MDKNQAVKKIKKLLELADTKRNTNLEEAAAAAAKAQSLMEKYRIEAALLKEASSRIQWKLLEDRGRPENWKNFLATALAKHNGCFMVRSQNYEADGELYAVGESQDIDVIQSIYSYVVFELNKLCIKELLLYKTTYGFYPSDNFKKSFYLGAIATVDDRLRVAREFTRQEQLKKAATNTDKVAIESALAVIDNKAEHAKDWVKNNIDNVEIKGVSIKNPDPNGYVAGKKAAKNLNLHTDAELTDGNNDRK